MKPATSQRCVAPWSEVLDDRNGMKTVTELWWDIGKDNYAFRSGEDSKIQGKSPFRDADMSLCQGLMWKDYGQKQRHQVRSLPTSCESISTTSSSWCQHVRADSASKNDFSFNNSGNPWATQEYVKTGSLYILRRMNPINDFWVRPEACCKALKRMITEADLEPQASEDDEPQTSFWSQFQASVASSSRTATLSAVLSIISEQDEDKENINEYESNNIMVAPPPTVASPSQQDQLNDQDYVNVIKVDEILGSMEETVDPVVVYGNKVEAEAVVQEYQATSQDYTQIVDLKKNDKNCIKLSDLPESEATDNADEPKLVDGDQEEKTVGMMNDKLEEERSSVYVMQEREVSSMAKKEQDQRDVVCSKQELKVNVHARETPCIRMAQNNSQLTTYKEPMEIVVKLSDIIHTSYQSNSKLSDLVEQSSAPVKRQVPPPSHLPRSRVTLADLM